MNCATTNAFFVNEMLSFRNGIISADAAVDKNTVAVWLFEEGSGKVVKDASGNGHDGEFSGSLKWVKARSGTGLEFPGDGGGYIVVDSTKKLELETLSIEAWVKVKEPTGKWQGILCKQEAGCTDRNYGIWVQVDQKVLHAQIGANGTCAFNVNNPVLKHGACAKRMPSVHSTS